MAIIASRAIKRQRHDAEREIERWPRGRNKARAFLREPLLTGPSLATRRFDPHVWDCFWRTVILCESPKDVAHDLGITVWAVYKNRSRCQERLQTELAPLGIDVSLEERDP